MHLRGVASQDPDFVAPCHPRYGGLDADPNMVSTQTIPVFPGVRTSPPVGYDTGRFGELFTGRLIGPKLDGRNPGYGALRAGVFGPPDNSPVFPTQHLDDSDSEVEQITRGVNDLSIGSFKGRLLDGRTSGYGAQKVGALALPLPANKRSGIAEVNAALVVTAPLLQLPPISKKQASTVNITQPRRRHSEFAQSTILSPIGSPFLDAKPHVPKPRRSTGGPECAAMTQSGSRCTRLASVTPPISMHSAPLDPENPGDGYCWQHAEGFLVKQPWYSGKITGEAGFQLTRTVKFSEFISDDLLDGTKIALREEMAHRVREIDSPGYIYCFQIMNEDTPNYVHYKIGRSNNVARRLSEWERQCSTYHQIPIGMWPEDASFSALKGLIGSGGKMVQQSGHLEALIHIEVADRACRRLRAFLGETQYDDSPATLRKIEEVMMSGKICVCGTAHKEIFTFPVITGNELDDHILPVIRLWLGFVGQGL